MNSLCLFELKVRSFQFVIINKIRIRIRIHLTINMTETINTWRGKYQKLKEKNTIYFCKK